MIVLKKILICCTVIIISDNIKEKYNSANHYPSWVYLSLHGTYGFLWLLKECIFPDPAWQKQSTLMEWISAWAFVLAPYWYMPWSINAYRTEVSLPLAAACISVHSIGLVLMMASDSQKYFVLKVKKGLISDGWFANCRNTNYLGEMMIYGSYAALTQDPISWGIVLFVWSLLFGRNMINKDKSIRKKKGGEQYIQNSWLVFPKPFGGSRKQE